MLFVLSACGSLPLSPTSPVPNPLPEREVMRDEIRNQYPTLQLMACLSSAAYVGQDSYEPFCKTWTHAPWTRISNASVTLTDLWGHPYDSYYIVWTDDFNRRQIIAIRGTDDLQDWEANLLFSPIYDPILKVSVHHGFSEYAQAVYESLTAKNARALNPAYDTYFAGHSLGGAVAVLTALYFYVQDPHPYIVKGVYTFGQPRVFDSRGATSWPIFALNVHHVENCYDPVPLVPVGYDILHSIFINPLDANAERRQYQHMGQEILLLNPGEFWISNGADIIRNLPSDLEVTYNDVRSGQQIDHSIGAYINRIAELRGDKASSGPVPVNPAYEFQRHCLPYRAQS
jgi:hypothetical protein